MSVGERLFKLALRFSNVIEPFARFGISYYVRRQLRIYKERGLIEAYRTKVQRLGKWHYRVDMTLDLTSSQTNRLVRQMVKRLEWLRR